MIDPIIDESIQRGETYVFAETAKLLNEAEGWFMEIATKWC